MTDTHAAAKGASAPDAAGEIVSLYAAQKKIYARAVSGWFATWRWVLVWATQLLFYGLPWLQWNGRQAVLFDLAPAASTSVGWSCTRRTSSTSPGC